jgi:hypothetical protein
MRELTAWMEKSVGVVRRPSMASLRQCGARCSRRGGTGARRLRRGSGVGRRRPLRG